MRVVSISGASGVGKTTLQEGLIEHHNYIQVLSHTTRPVRVSDRENEYRYLSVDKFLTLTDLLWSIEIHSNYYATLQSELCKAAGEGAGAVIVLCVDSILLLNQFCSSQNIHHTAVHLLSPAEKILRERLLARGDSKKDTARRLKECSVWDERVRTMEFVRLIPPMSQLETFHHVVKIVG